MSTYTHLVTRFVQELQSKNADADTVTMVNAMLCNWESELQQHFTGKTTKKQRRVQNRDPNAPPRTNWQAVWTSNANGCRAYPEFQTHLQSIETANPNMGRFEVNKRLKEWANEHGHYAEWQEWAKARLIAEGKPVPQDKASTETAVEETTESVAVEDGQTAPQIATKPVVAPVTRPATKPRGKTARQAVAAPVAN